MSDSVQPHRRQPTRLPRLWDSPGKNTGVGYHFLLQCVKVKALSHVWLLATPWTAAHQAPPSRGFYRQEYWSGLPLPSPALITEEDFLISPCYLWNSAFKLVYLSFSPLLFTSLLFTGICKASSDNNFAFLYFFYLGMVLILASCTMSQTSIHSYSGTLSF